MARTWFKASQLTRQTLTGTTSFSDVLTLNIASPAASTDYYLLWSMQADYNSTGRTCSFRLRDSTGASDLGTPTQRTQNTSNVFSVGGVAKWTSGGSPGSQDFTIGHAPGNVADTVGSDEIFLVALQKDSADQYAEDLAAASRTSSALADKATLTFTPGSAGDYLVIASAEVGGLIPATVNGVCRVLLDVDGVEYLDTVDGYQANTAATRMAWAGALVVNLTAASHTIKIRYAASDNTNTANIRNTRILAMRLDSFAASATAQDNTEQSSTSQTYAAAAAVSPTAVAAEYLVLTAGLVRHSTSATSMQSRVNVDGTPRSLQERFQMSGSGTRKASFIGFGYDTLAAGSRTIATEWRRNTASAHTAYITDAFVGALLPVGIAAAYGAYSLTGQALALKASRQLLASVGTLALTGQALALKASRTLALAYGSHALTGQAVALKAGRALLIGQSAFALSGQDVTLTYTPSAAATLAMGQGSFALTGQAVALRASRQIVLGIGALALTGQSLALRADHTVSLAVGTVTYTGQSAALQVNRPVVIGHGAFALTGQALTLKADHTVTLGHGSVVLTGQAAALKHAAALVLASAGYTLSGQAISLKAARQILAEYASYVLTGIDAEARSSRIVILSAFLRVRPALDGEIETQAALDGSITTGPALLADADIRPVMGGAVHLRPALAGKLGN